jgi:hypothetical protein
VTRDIERQVNVTARDAPTILTVRHTVLLSFSYSRQLLLNVVPWILTSTLKLNKWPCSRQVRFLLSFISLSFRLEVLIVREEDVGGSETHEMSTFQPYTSSVASLPLPVCTGQDVGNVAQLVVSQAQPEGVTSISLSRRIQRHLFCYFYLN